jgi:hypothetical protein
MKTIAACLLATIVTTGFAKPVEINEYHSAQEVLDVVPARLLAKPTDTWTAEDIDTANAALAEHVNGQTGLFTYNVQEVRRNTDEFHDGKWVVISKEESINGVPVWHFDYFRSIPDGAITVGQKLTVASTIRIAVFVRRDKKVALQIDMDACQLWVPPGKRSPKNLSDLLRHGD